MDAINEKGDPQAFCHKHDVSYQNRVYDPGHFTFCAVPDKGFDVFLFAMVALLAAAVIQGKSGLSALMVLSAGALLQVVALVFGGHEVMGPLNNSLALWLGIEPAELFLYAFLPPLLLESAINIEFFKLKKFIVPVMTFAFLVVLGGTGLMVIVLSYVLGLGRYWNWAQMAVFTAIIASTDAVTVNAMLKSGGGPDELVVLMEGESLFNDASSMVMFTVFYEMSQSAHVLPAVDAIPVVAKEVLKLASGGALLGYVMGYVARKLIAHMQSRGCKPAQEITIIFASVYLSMYIGQAVLNVSGVIAVVVFSLYGASKGEWYITSKAHEQLHGFVNTVSFGVQGVVFFYAGASSINFLYRALEVLKKHGMWRSILLLFAIYVAMFVVRYVCIQFFNQFFALLKMALPWNVVAFATVGALRGALSLIMVQVVIQDKARDNERKGEEEEQIDIVTAQMVLWTAGFVLCTLLINAPLMPWFMRITGLITEAPASRMMRAKAKRALLRFTEAAIADLKNDEDEMLRGVDWQHVKEYTDLQEGLKKFGELPAPVVKDEAGAQENSRQPGASRRSGRRSIDMSANNNTAALQETLLPSPAPQQSPASTSLSRIFSLSKRRTNSGEVEGKLSNQPSGLHFKQESFVDEEPLRVAGKKNKGAKTPEAPFKLDMDMEEGQQGAERVLSNETDSKPDLPFTSNDINMVNEGRPVMPTPVSPYSGASFMGDTDDATPGLLKMSGSGVLVPVLAKVGEEEMLRGKPPPRAEWVPTPTASKEDSVSKAMGALAYLQRSSHQNRSTKISQSVSHTEILKGTLHRITSECEIPLDEAEVLAESRMRLISGMKRFLHMKRTEGLLSSRGLQILDYSCDIAIDHPDEALMVWKLVEREVVGRVWVRLLARLNYYIRMVARNTEGCCGWLGLHYLITLVSGYLSHQLSSKMLLACEVGVAYFLALSYTPFAQILISKEGKGKNALQEEIIAEAEAVWKFIIDREIEAPERFQAIQSYRAAMAILHQQAHFVSELYLAGMVDDTEQEMMMDVIEHKIRSLERSGASWRSPKNIEFVRALPFFNGVSDQLFMEVFESGELLSYESGQIVVNPIASRIGDHGVLAVVHGLVKGYSIVGNKCREFYLGSGSIVGLMSTLTGQPSPGAAGIVTEGNALGKGPVLFHLPKYKILDIVQRAKEGDVECQQLELDMYRVASLNIVDMCKTDVISAASLHYTRMLTSKAIAAQESVSRRGGGGRTAGSRAGGRGGSADATARDILQGYSSDQSEEDSDEEDEEVFVDSSSGAGRVIRGRQLRSIESRARRLALDLLQSVRDAISEGSLVLLPRGGVLHMTSHTVLARGRIRVRAVMNERNSTAGGIMESMTAADADKFELVVEFSGPYYLPWLYDKALGVLDGGAGTAGLVPQPIVLEAVQDCTLLVTQSIESLGISPTPFGVPRAVSSGSLRSRKGKNTAAPVQEECARLLHEYSKMPDKLSGMCSNPELFAPSAQRHPQQAARVVHCSKIEEGT